MEGERRAREGERRTRGGRGSSATAPPQNISACPPAFLLPPSHLAADAVGGEDGREEEHGEAVERLLEIIVRDVELEVRGLAGRVGVAAEGSAEQRRREGLEISRLFTLSSVGGSPRVQPNRHLLPPCSTKNFEYSSSSGYFSLEKNSMCCAVIWGGGMVE